MILDYLKYIMKKDPNSKRRNGASKVLELFQSGKILNADARLHGRSISFRKEKQLRVLTEEEIKKYIEPMNKSEAGLSKVLGDKSKLEKIINRRKFVRKIKNL
jgi:N-glycosylase/DNA lyase